MARSRHISITVRYEPDARWGTSLAWIAPELRHADLRLVEDHLDDPCPTRTWSGFVEDRTFRRFATVWRLPREDEEFSGEEAVDRNETVAYTKTLDGMNWEIEGVSPIISVWVEVTRRPRAVSNDVHDSAFDVSRARTTSLRVDG